jgi:phosphoglycerol transferase MdoB-like AlkP superfamily enzyme
MTGLFHAHSGLRFLVLLLAVVNIAVLGIGLAQKRPFAKIHRILGASYAGCLHLQLVLGVSMVALGYYRPVLIGHIVMMVLAAVVAQVAMSRNRRSAAPTLTLPLVGVIVSLVLIAGGVMAIGRGLFSTLPLGS